MQKTLVKWLAFTNVYFSESRVINGLRPEERFRATL
jgi:hypothetical protein